MVDKLIFWHQFSDHVWELQGRKISIFQLLVLAAYYLPNNCGSVVKRPIDHSVEAHSVYQKDGDLLEGFFLNPEASRTGMEVATVTFDSCGTGTGLPPLLYFRIRLRLRLKSFFLRLQFRRSLRIFFPAASASLVSPGARLGPSIDYLRNEENAWEIELKKGLWKTDFKKQTRVEEGRGRTWVRQKGGNSTPIF